MKRLLVLPVLLAFLLPGCIEMEQTTTIYADGSGKIDSELNMDGMIDLFKMAMDIERAKKGDSLPNEAPVIIDTLVYMKDHAGTSAQLTEKEKSLVQDMTLGIKMNTDTRSFRVRMNIPFKSQTDLAALDKLMSSEKYNRLFDAAMTLPQLDNDAEKSPFQSTSRGNLFSMLAPSFFIRQYTKGALSVKVDMVKYQKMLKDLKKDGMDINEKNARDLMGTMKIVNRYVLPFPAKTVTGTALKKESASTLVLTADAYKLYKNPKKYEYTIKY